MVVWMIIQSCSVCLCNAYQSGFIPPPLYPPNVKRVAVEAGLIYDQLSGGQSKNFVDEMKLGDEKIDSNKPMPVNQANEIIEMAREGKSKEESDAIEISIRNVILDAEMQLQNFLEGGATQKVRVNKSAADQATSTSSPFAIPLLNENRNNNNNNGPWANVEGDGEEESGGFFEEFFSAGIFGGRSSVPQPIYDAPRYDEPTLATQPFGTNLPLDNIPPRPNVDPNYVTYTAQGLMGSFMQALTYIIAVPFANNPTFFDDWQRCSTLIRPCTIRETLSRCTYEPRNSWYRERRSRINAPVSWPYCQPDLEEVYEFCSEWQLQGSVCDPSIAREKRDIALFEANRAAFEEEQRIRYEQQQALYHSSRNAGGAVPNGGYYGPALGGVGAVPTNGGGQFYEEGYYQEGFGYPYQQYDPYAPFPYYDQQPNYYFGARLG